MPNPEYTPIDLCDNIEEAVVSIIECSECKTGTHLQMPDHHAAKIWWEQGWRGNANGVYCPTCSVKLKLI